MKKASYDAEHAPAYYYVDGVIDGLDLALHIVEYIEILHK